MIDQLVHYDKEFFLFLNNLGTAQWDGFWLFMTNKWSSIPLYILLAFLTYRAFGLKRLLISLVAIALLILATDQLANFFKYGVQRLRPCHDPSLNGLMRLVKGSCGGKFGYFSAHAANSFAVAFFFVSLFRTKYKSFRVVLIVWALVVAYSRIYIGVHFPMDVLTGILIGTFLGGVFFHLFLKFVAKFAR